MPKQTPLGILEVTENKRIIHWFPFSAIHNWYTKYVGGRKLKWNTNLDYAPILT